MRLKRLMSGVADLACARKDRSEQFPSYPIIFILSIILKTNCATPQSVSTTDRCASCNAIPFGANTKLKFCLYNKANGIGMFIKKSPNLLRFRKSFSSWNDVLFLVLEDSGFVLISMDVLQVMIPIHFVKTRGSWKKDLAGLIESINELNLSLNQLNHNGAPSALDHTLSHFSLLKNSFIKKEQGLFPLPSNIVLTSDGT